MLQATSNSDKQLTSSLRSHIKYALQNLEYKINNVISRLKLIIQKYTAVEWIWNLHVSDTRSFKLNLLKPTAYVMHQQFNIQQLYALPTLYLCVLYLSENKQRLVPLTA